MAKARPTSATVDIKIRMKEPLRADIERAAKAKSISMNAEMVARLSNSLDREKLLEEVIEWSYGPEFSGLLMLLIPAAGLAGQRASLPHYAWRDWMFDRYAVEQSAQAANRIFERLMPSKEKGESDGRIVDRALSRAYPAATSRDPDLGKKVADGILWRVEYSDFMKPDDLGVRIRQKLGAVGERIPKSKKAPKGVSLSSLRSGR